MTPTDIDHLRVRRHLEGHVVSEQASIPPLVAERYEQYLKDNHGEIDVPRLCAVMFSAGARSAIAAMTTMADITPTLHRLEDRIRVLAEMMELMQEAGK